MKTKLVLVPSLEDVFHPSVFPQAPFTDRIKGGGRQISIPQEEFTIGTLGINWIEKAGREGDVADQSQRVFCVSNPGE